MLILKITPKNLINSVEIAVKLIRQGKAIVYPTDTVYGLLADAANEKAVKKIFKIKKRPEKKPLPIFVKDLKMAKNLALIDKPQEKFLRKAWFTRPNFKETWAGKGKITAVLKRKKTKLYGVEKQTIALRIPKHKLVNKLLEKINRPLVGTSANISGKPASTKIKEVIGQFKEQKKDRPDLIIDAGDLKPSKPSTIIDLTGKEPIILRE